MAEGRKRPAWLVVARREYSIRVRSWWFIVVTLLGPLGLGSLILIPTYVSARGAQQVVRIQVLDSSGHGIGELAVDAMAGLQPQIRAELIAADTPEATLMARLRDGQVEGFLLVNPGVLLHGLVWYRGVNATNLGFLDELKQVVQSAVWRRRWLDAELPPDRYDSLHRGVVLVPEHTTGTSQAASGPAALIIGYSVMFVLYLSILMYAINLMRSVVEEKSNRVVELIVSSIKPLPLMLGKIVGVGAAGLTQLVIWVTVAVVLFDKRMQLLQALGVDVPGGHLTFPSIRPGVAAVVLGFFVLGYFFYAAMYAAVGAIVNSEHEAQQVQTPVVALMMLPVAFLQIVANDPRSAAADLLTLLPFSSPVLMPLRYLLGGASAVTVAAALAILAVSLAAIVWLTARIYRTGILMYGKRPSVRELLRWVRHG
jgi:ABC-2 type transport system permease protein